MAIYYIYKIKIIYVKKKLIIDDIKISNIKYRYLFISRPKFLKTL